MMEAQVETLPPVSVWVVISLFMVMAMWVVLFLLMAVLG